MDLEDFIKQTALCLLCALVGAGALCTAAMDWQLMSIAGTICAAVFGTAMIAGSVFWLIKFLIPEAKQFSTVNKDNMLHLVSEDQTGSPDSDSTDALLTAFRENLREFFAVRGAEENPPVKCRGVYLIGEFFRARDRADKSWRLQNTVTQLFWHVLFLQKRRLDAKNITIEFQSERRTYDGMSVSKSSYFDGKYDITEAKERIAAKRTFMLGWKNIGIKIDDELAHYSILNTRKVFNGRQIVCPSCGNNTTRENLLDGCDFCGTKFTVEDLGTRVSSFALRHDYQIAYDKYRDARSRYSRRAFLAGAVIAAVISLFGFLISSADIETGIIMKFVVIMLGTGVLSVMAGYMAMWTFMFAIFPMVQIFHSALYYTEASRESRKKRESKSEELVREIRRHDPLFSIQGFFGNIQNKLAAICYAGHIDEVHAFAPAVTEEMLRPCSNIVDMEILEIQLKDYKAEKSVQKITAEAIVQLISAENSKISRRRDAVTISLEKNADCKTEAVCAPSVLKCRKCGAGLSLLNGGKCEYCGNELNLKEFDWVITDFQSELGKQK